MTYTARFTVFAQWLAMGVVVGLVTGTASALFLFLLDEATAFREGHETIVYALPLAGLLIGWLYERFGRPISAGNDLVIDTIHDDGPEIPLRMAPMVLVGTVLTHLFGGSAGREGTAVQMGASLSDFVSNRLRLSPALRCELLSAGVAGGFGSVFGTPVAGALFGLEFVVVGRLQHRGMVPAVVAAVVGDLTTRAWNITHTAYPTVPLSPPTPTLLGKWLLVALAVALTTGVFIEAVHFIKRTSQRWPGRLPLRMMMGGAAIVLLWRLVGSSAYLGLGVPTIVRAFSDPELPAFAFALKLVFTAVTLGAGFLGGEVTPLFFIGATLGSALARALGVPLELGAAIGLAAAFGTASNAPIALSVMAVELFGVGVLPHVVVVSALAWVLAGHRGIYGAQRLAMGKFGGPLSPVVRLGDLRRGSDTHVKSGSSG